MGRTELTCDNFRARIDIAAVFLKHLPERILRERVKVDFLFLV
jgi:hypothetical protein